jgi:hypothetical protein
MVLFAFYSMFSQGCNDRNRDRFAAAFGGLEVDSNLFYGAQEKKSKFPFNKPLGISASVTINGDKSQVRPSLTSLGVELIW